VATPTANAPKANHPKDAAARPRSVCAPRVGSARGAPNISITF
jgi:hypothetical protein